MHRTAPAWRWRGGKEVKAARLLPLPTGVKSLRASFRVQPHSCLKGHPSPEGTGPEKSAGVCSRPLSTYTRQVVPPSQEFGVPTAAQQVNTPCQRSPWGRARCKEGLLWRTAQTVTVKVTAHQEKLLAGPRSPRPVKATCPRVTSRGGSGHLRSWTMERPSALREGQRNAPLMGTATQAQLPVAEGTKMNHSYQTWRRQKREKEQH